MPLQLDRSARSVSGRRTDVVVDSVHDSCWVAYRGQMAASAKRINVTLDDEHAGKLARLAERTHVQEGTLARSLLATALDDADPDAARITEILDAIPGAWERTQEGLAQAARGEGTPLDGSSPNGAAA